jgi:CDP-glucose 4,6-dehydratase
MSPAPLSRTFWAGRRVFVTGHTGFKGGWLMALLSRLGAKPAGYALAPPSTPNLFTTAGIEHFGPSTLGDIREQAPLDAAIRDAAPDIVLHLAAQALVRPARAEPVETFSTNVVGTAHVLDAVRKTQGVKACVVITSDKVYDNVEWAWAYRETDRLGGKEPYGASKACTEIVVEAYRASYFSEEGTAMLASARAGNVIGGGDWAEDRLIPDAVRAFSAVETLSIRNPASVRPWQHVLEPLSGYLTLAEALVSKPSALPKPLAFNFGPAQDDAVPVREIVDQVCARWGDGVAWTHDARFQPYEARLLEVDSAKARAALGWTPRWRLDRALDRTVAWYKAHRDGQDMHAFTLSQIDEYLDG